MRTVIRRNEWGGGAPDPKAMPDGRNKHRSSKDTKRWCLGKPGREHDGRYEPSERYTYARGYQYPPTLEYRCLHCRKQLKTDVNAFRAPFAWLHPDGRLRDYNQRGCKPVPFYGPGLPPSNWLCAKEP